MPGTAPPTLQKTHAPRKAKVIEPDMKIKKLLMTIISRVAGTMIDTRAPRRKRIPAATFPSMFSAIATEFRNHASARDAFSIFMR